jgi:succinyl-diaminopimelate desuccinylase
MNHLEIQPIFRQLENLKPEMTEALTRLIHVPAVAPENGGDGEQQKAEKLAAILATVGFDRIERFDAEDSRVSSGKRPNIITYLNGETNVERLWIVTHLDVVPAGEETLWTITKPFEPKLADKRVYGRGSEDNGQSLVASIFAAKALKQSRLKQKRTLALAFVSDEEQGSTFGIQHLIAKGLFGNNDLVVVPDGGNENGSFIEVAEKSILWFRVRTIGKQAHGSLPNKGLMASRVGMQAALALDQRLHKKYSLKDAYFDVPESTFEPTKKEKNVDAMNIIPGEDVLYFDCRILPNYNLDEVEAEINGVLAEVERKTGAIVRLEVLQKQAAPKMLNGNSAVATLLKKAVKKARGIDANVGGIGGGSCAAFFRKAGIPAVVWSTVDDVAHQPNEYAKVENMVADAKVFALLAMV